MITAITINNVKCFGELRIDFSALTLLTGFNAAGKSTSYQPLLLLAQAIRAGADAEFLGLNGPLVRLGTAGEVVSSRTGEISVQIDTDTANVKWVFKAGSAAGSGALLAHSATSNSTSKRKREHSWTEKIRPGQEWLFGLGHLFEDIRDVIFLSAARLGTAEAFPAPDDAAVSHADVGSRGEYAPWWYDRFADDEIPQERRHSNEKAGTLRRQLDAFLGDLFPGAQATAETLSRTSLVRLGLRTSTASDWRRPANTGYGLTYAFPTLVSLLLAKKGQTVIIDSPEAHLHPRGQSIIGRQLAHFAAAGVRIIVETHSDHVLNGIRCAIHEKHLESSQVAIYFFNESSKASSDSQVMRLNVDSLGNIETWPDGFFDQSERDLSVLSGWELP